MALLKMVRLAPGVLLGLAGMLCGGVVNAEQDQTSPASKSSQYVSRDTVESSTNSSHPKKSGKAGAAKPSATAAASPANANSPLNADAYRIGVDDELQISVWREPELSGPVAVRPDGMITLPLLNDLYVVGQTPQELQASLTDKLKPLVNEPQVTVIVRAIRSRRVYLVGQVPHPGAYALSGSKTVLQLIAEAGGLGVFAKSSSIYVLRHQNGHEIRIPFSYRRAIKGIPAKDEVVLVPGDMVVVP